MDRNDGSGNVSTFINITAEDESTYKQEYVLPSVPRGLSFLVVMAQPEAEEGRTALYVISLYGIQADQKFLVDPSTPSGVLAGDSANVTIMSLELDSDISGT